MTAQFALPAAVSFGVADFAGGLAARRTSALLVTTLVQLAGAAAGLAGSFIGPTARAGALGVSAVLVSLYPVVVVVLARLVLRERLNPVQLVSVALALAAGAVLSTAA